MLQKNLELRNEKGKRMSWGDEAINQNSYLFRLFAENFFLFSTGANSDNPSCYTVQTVDA